MAYMRPERRSRKPIEDNPGTDDMPKSSDEEISVFLPKEALMGKTVKEGDTFQMRAKSIDPETGEVEAVCVKDSYGGNGNEESGLMADMDRMMPEEEG